MKKKAVIIMAAALLLLTGCGVRNSKPDVKSTTKSCISTVLNFLMPSRDYKY